MRSSTGLLASLPRPASPRGVSGVQVELRCDVVPATFVLRPFADLFNPYPGTCSVLCNHPADVRAKAGLKRAKESLHLEGNSHEDYSIHKEMRTHDLVSEDMFRRYAETDSRPLTPAPTLASGKSRGSRRCLTPNQPAVKTSIVVDLRRSHSQDTVYYHSYARSDLTAGNTNSSPIDRSLPSTLPSVPSGITRYNATKYQREHVTSLVQPLTLAARTPRDPVVVHAQTNFNKIRATA